MIERAGRRYERTRRLPVAITRRGAGAPAPGARGILAEYDAPGRSRLVVLAGAERVMAWEGTALDASEVDVLPGGGPTADE